MDELNFRQKKFCREYIKNKGIIARAAIKAGYSKSYAYARAHEMLENVGIQEYIKKITENGTDVDLMDVLQELKSISFSKMTDYLKVKNKTVELFNTEDIPEEAIPAIKKIKQKIKNTGEIELEYELHDKIKGLQLLGSHLGLGKQVEKEEDEEDGLLDALLDTPEEWNDE